MKPLLTGSEKRACSFFSEDAGMAEAYPEIINSEKANQAYLNFSVEFGFKESDNR